MSDAPIVFLGKPLEQRVAELEERIRVLESRAGLQPTRTPDLGNQRLARRA